MISYQLLDGRRDLARLKEAYVRQTSIVGHEGALYNTEDRCSLSADGELIVASGFVWDFGFGPAIDTPDMVQASLVHDAFCRLCDQGALPTSVRAQADREFREHLKELGTSFLRRWYCYLAVRAYSIVKSF